MTTLAEWVQAINKALGARALGSEGTRLNCREKALVTDTATLEGLARVLDKLDGAIGTRRVARWNVYDAGNRPEEPATYTLCLAFPDEPWSEAEIQWETLTFSPASGGGEETGRERTGQWPFRPEEPGGASRMGVGTGFKLPYELASAAIVGSKDEKSRLKEFLSSGFDQCEKLADALRRSSKHETTDTTMGSGLSSDFGSGSSGVGAGVGVGVGTPTTVVVADSAPSTYVKSAAMAAPSDDLVPISANASAVQPKDVSASVVAAKQT
jgi:hypothetical protein